MIDLFGPTARDEQGFPGAVWVTDDDSHLAAVTEERPFSLTACQSDLIPIEYSELPGVGDELTPMPLFLTAESYVYVPLSETYSAAWQGVPAQWKRIVEGEPA